MYPLKLTYLKAITLRPTCIQISCEILLDRVIMVSFYTFFIKQIFVKAVHTGASLAPFVSESVHSAMICTPL